jgi:hypothetical protein
LRRILDEAPKPANQCVVFDARLEMVIVLLGVLVHVALPRSAQSYRAIVRPQWV